MDQEAFTFSAPAKEVPPAKKEEPTVFTVTALTASLKDLVESSFLDVWVSGEVSNFRNPTSRHWYFSLKDKNAQVRAIIFGAGSRKIPFKLEDGLEVICHGHVDVYPPQGSYSLIIDHIEPKGIGALQLAFEQLKKRLDTEGLFNPAHKKQLPFLPQTIGIVTSPTGAAIQDMIHVLTRRSPGVNILLYPVRVQGDGASEEIARALENLNTRDDIDVIIVGRGGGSLEDLWAFNEERVARAIFLSRIPVISAVGHEIDFTIADFVADVRAPTPSAAAEIAVPVKEELVALVDDRKRQLAAGLRQAIIRAEQHWVQLKKRLRDPRARFPDLLLRIDELRQRLHYACDVGFDKYRQRLAELSSNLHNLSPLAILAKGYAVVQRVGSGESVRSAETLQAGDDLSLRFHEGSALATVKKV